MEIEVFCVTANDGERFAILGADAGRHKLFGPEGPFTETELRARLTGCLRRSLLVCDAKTLRCSKLQPK